jgi:hypothetical protein
VGFARRVCRAAEGCGSAGNDRRLEPSPSGDLTRVARRAGDVGVPMTGRDPHDVQRVEARRERERHGIIDSRIGID